MAADPKLIDRLRRALRGHDAVTEKVMFGGVCFLAGGHMVGGVSGDRYMFRVGPEQQAAALKRPEASPMDFTGKPLKGFAWVEAGAPLAWWVNAAARFIETLPARTVKPLSGRTARSRRSPRTTSPTSRRPSRRPSRSTRR